MPDEQLTRVVYTSRAVTAFDERELDALLGLSQANNRRVGLTGYLLHLHGDEPDDAWFAQVLEGPRDVLTKTLERIEADELHHDVHVLIDEPIEARTLAAWAMELDVMRVSNTNLHDAAAVEELLYN